MELPAHTALTLELPSNLPLRLNETVRANLLYPVYCGTILALPRDTVVTGKVIALHADRSTRIRSRFNLDFTPFRVATVQFDSIALPSGETLGLATGPVEGGAVTVHLSARPQQHQSFIRQQFTAAVHLVRDTAVFVTAPGKGDRLLQLVYHQLPWHPQRIARGTVWTAETQQPLVLPSASSAPSPSLGADIEATLDQSLSSASVHAGETIRATVAAPIAEPSLHLSIPAGSTLLGTITQARPSRSFARPGALHFEFRQVQLPTGHSQPIDTLLVGVDAPAAQDLSLDSEGGLAPAPRDKVVVPAILLALAAAPLVPDPGDNDEFFKNAGASNSLGTAGFITGISVNRASVSAAFGFYGASLSIAERWLRHGDDVVFPRGTRIVLQWIPTRKPSDKLTTAAGD